MGLEHGEMASWQVYESPDRRPPWLRWCYLMLSLLLVGSGHRTLEYLKRDTKPSLAPSKVRHAESLEDTFRRGVISQSIHRVDCQVASDLMG